MPVISPYSLIAILLAYHLALGIAVGFHWGSRWYMWRKRRPPEQR